MPRSESRKAGSDVDPLDVSGSCGEARDPGYVLGSRQLLDLVQRGHWTLVGMDPIEVNPTRDLRNPTSTLAARVLQEGMGYPAKSRTPAD